MTELNYSQQDLFLPPLPNKELKYLFYLVNCNQPQFKELYSGDAGISKDEAEECYSLIEFVNVSTIDEIIYDLTNRPNLSNHPDNYFITQFYHRLYFTQEENEINARSKSFSFENTDELAELMISGNIRSILSLIQYDRTTGIKQLMIHQDDNNNDDDDNLRVNTGPIGLYVIGNISVPIPIQYLDHFRLLRVKDEKEMMDIQYRRHPDPPYYVQFDDGKLLLRNMYAKFNEFTVYDLLDDSFEKIIWRI